jgi:hypothetical protein
VALFAEVGDQFGADEACPTEDADRQFGWARFQFRFQTKLLAGLKP